MRINCSKIKLLLCDHLEFKMDRQHLNEKLQVLQEELYATHHILQDNIDLRQRVNMDRESFPDAEIFMQDIGKSIMDATEIRDILIKEIEVVEDKIFRETKIVTMQEFLAIHELDVDYSESTVELETVAPNGHNATIQLPETNLQIIEKVDVINENCSHLEL